MTTPIWLEMEAVLAMQEELIRIFGGTSGIRDAGLLESALDRAKNIHSYEPESTLHRLAAAYANGIIRNHPFIDGNKRAGFMCAYTFLLINGLEIEAAEAEVVEVTLALTTGDLSEEEYAAWLADRCVPLKD